MLTCTRSPELISAQARSDYNVYYIDFAECDLPRTSQGMLSELLASHSRSAQLSDDDGMIVGRVCKNIMGLFNSGVKETLEIKLELQPIDQPSREEWLNNINIYRSSKGMKAVSDYPMTPSSDGVIAPIPHNPRSSVGGIEAFHHVLTARTPREDDCCQTSQSRNGSRAGSPALSHRSGMTGQEMHVQQIDTSFMQQAAAYESPVFDNEFEDGPARKRARLTQADWRGRGSFGTQAGPLRAVASTAASIRDFRPVQASNTSLVNDLMPRAPTPRAAEKRPVPLQRAAFANSSLRRFSTGEMSTTPSPTSEADTPQLEPLLETAVSTPWEFMPSSPPQLYLAESVAPSSPGLPEAFDLNDLGQATDLDMLDQDAAEEQPPIQEDKTTEKAKHRSEQRRRIKEKNSQMDWIAVKPGPTSMLPTTTRRGEDFKVSHAAARSAVPSSPGGKATKGKRDPVPDLSSLPPPAMNTGALIAASPTPTQPDDLTQCYDPTPELLRTASAPGSLPGNIAQAAITAGAPQPQRMLSLPGDAPLQPKPQSATASSLRPLALPSSRPTSPCPVQQDTTASNGPISKPCALPPKQTTVASGARRDARMRRAESWNIAMSSDIDSDAGGLPDASNRGLKRSRSTSDKTTSHRIKKQLEASVASGEAPKFCPNCGEVKPATWRCYWILEADGAGEDIPVGKGTGVHWVEPLIREPKTGKILRHRIYKQWSHLTSEQRESGLWVQLTFCSPCGDYIRKHQAVRPMSLWNKEAQAALPKGRGKSRAKAKSRANSTFHSDVGFLTSDVFTDSAYQIYTDPSSEMPPGMTDQVAPSVFSPPNEPASALAPSPIKSFASGTVAMLAQINEREPLDKENQDPSEPPRTPSPKSKSALITPPLPGDNDGLDYLFNGTSTGFTPLKTPRRSPRKIGDATESLLQTPSKAIMGIDGIDFGSDFADFPKFTPRTQKMIDDCALGATAEDPFANIDGFDSTFTWGDTLKS